MASVPLFPVVLCSASSSRSNHHPKQDSTHPKGNSGWWTPLFGWSSDPDYIGQVQGSNNKGNRTKADPGRSDKEEGMSIRSKFGVGCFTEEKAKELRRKTTETSNFHDIMYHSAIASRLASDVSGGQGI